MKKVGGGCGGEGKGGPPAQKRPAQRPDTALPQRGALGGGARGGAGKGGPLAHSHDVAGRACAFLCQRAFAPAYKEHYRTPIMAPFIEKAGATDTQRAANEHSRAVGARNRAHPAPATGRVGGAYIITRAGRRKTRQGGTPCALTALPPTCCGATRTKLEQRGRFLLLMCYASKPVSNIITQCAGVLTKAKG